MEVKDRILQKAGELFMQLGIRSVSMDDIANHLGMSKKTLYQYFDDKDALVEAFVNGHISLIEHDCLSCRTEAKNAIHEIFLTMEHIVAVISNMNPMLLYDLEKFYFRAFQRFREYKNKFLLELVRKNIEWGIKEELYRPEVNVDVLSKFRIECMMIPFNVSAFPPGKYNLGETSLIMIENFIYGLATIKGHKLIQKYNEQRKNSLINEDRKN